MATIDPTRKCVSDVVHMGLYKNDGTKLASGATIRDNVFYCDYPGERMFEKTQFEINGNVLDEYDDYTHVFARQFKLKKDKETGYKRSVGQEVAREARTDAVNGVRHGSVVLDGL